MLLIPISEKRHGIHSAQVAANQPLCRDHYRLDLLLEDFPSTEPGQFIQLTCREPRERDADSHAEHIWSEATWPEMHDADLVQRQAFLRRPFSLAGRVDREDGIVLSVIHRVVGIGTDWLADLDVGDQVDLIGPLGNRFPPPAHGSAILIGGGVGIPPMLYLAQHFSQRWRSMQVLTFCGATTRDLMPLNLIDVSNVNPGIPRERSAEFAQFNVQSVIATDDGTFGFRGLVTAALEEYLDGDLVSNPSGPAPTLYTCGPEGMMKRVAAIAAERGLPCYVAVERAMGCGMGTCQSCVIRLRIADHWRYALSCTEGPVFPANDLLW